MSITTLSQKITLALIVFTILILLTLIPWALTRFVFAPEINSPTSQAETQAISPLTPSLEINSLQLMSQKTSIQAQDLQVYDIYLLVDDNALDFFQPKIPLDNAYSDLDS